MRYSVFTVVVLCLLLAGISSVLSQRGRGRIRGRPSRIIGCRNAGYRSCCRRGSCFVPRGNCYCDIKCHLYRDCCFDICHPRIRCGGCIAKGCPPRGGCCKKPYPRCYSRCGRCWCDTACYFFRDCCKDIRFIGCPRRTITAAAARRIRGGGIG